MTPSEHWKDICSDIQNLIDYYRKVQRIKQNVAEVAFILMLLNYPYLDVTNQNFETDTYHYQDMIVPITEIESWNWSN